MKNIITKEIAEDIAIENLEKYLAADFGQRLVSDMENPLFAYIQDQNSYSQAGEVFSVTCPGIGNLDLSEFRDEWDSERYTDMELIHFYCGNGDMTERIKDLAESIYESANEDAD